MKKRFEKDPKGFTPWKILMEEILSKGYAKVFKNKSIEWKCGVYLIMEFTIKPSCIRFVFLSIVVKIMQEDQSRKNW